MPSCPEPRQHDRDRERSHLQADCERCFGLCCVALPFAASADFALDKPAGQPCPNLRSDFRCGIHAGLRGQGFKGCTVYDCFGAGQKVSQTTFGGRDWRRFPDTARLMFEAFPVMRQLHELLWHLTEALAFPAASPIHAELRSALDETERLARLDPASLPSVDIAMHRASVGALLRRASKLARDEALRSLRVPPGRRRTFGRNADRIGADLRGADLRAADLRGAYLIAADLRDADLRAADLLGADLRDAELGGADLTGALFLTQTQLNSAKGDGAAKLSPPLSRPSHWTGRRDG